MCVCVRACVCVRVRVHVCVRERAPGVGGVSAAADYQGIRVAGCNKVRAFAGEANPMPIVINEQARDEDGGQPLSSAKSRLQEQRCHNMFERPTHTLWLGPICLRGWGRAGHQAISARAPLCSWLCMVEGGGGWALTRYRAGLVGPSSLSSCPSFLFRFRFSDLYGVSGRAGYLAGLIRAPHPYTYSFVRTYTFIYVLCFVREVGNDGARTRFRSGLVTPVLFLLRHLYKLRSVVFQRFLCVSLIPVCTFLSARLERTAPAPDFAVVW